MQRLVQLLHARGRDADADAKLRKYEQGGGQLSGELLRLAAETALRVGGTDRAVALARPVLPRDGGDYRQYLWVGQFLLAADHATEAEEPLRQAIALFDQRPNRGWRWCGPWSARRNWPRRKKC